MYNDDNHQQDDAQSPEVAAGQLLMSFSLAVEARMCIKPPIETQFNLSPSKGAPIATPYPSNNSSAQSTPIKKGAETDQAANDDTKKVSGIPIVKKDPHEARKNKVARNLFGARVNNGAKPYVKQTVMGFDASSNEQINYKPKDFMPMFMADYKPKDSMQVDDTKLSFSDQFRFGMDSPQKPSVHFEEMDQSSDEPPIPPAVGVYKREQGFKANSSTPAPNTAASTSGKKSPSKRWIPIIRPAPKNNN